MRAQRRRTAPRGQSIVEASLGMLVFVTILLFGIHFAETTVLSMKVTEASAAPLWDSTAGQLHSLPGQFTQASAALANARNNAAARYATFDGRSGSPPGSSVTEALTGAGGLRIQCQMGGGGAMPLIGQGWSPGFAGGAYQDNNGAACTATARIYSVNIPRNFADGTNGIFTVDQSRAAQALTVCALGRPPCQGTMSMMIDDWGQSRQQESAECQLDQSGSGVGCTRNDAFSQSVKSVWSSSGKRTNEFTALVSTIVGGMPADLPTADNFYASYRGEESSFLERTDEGDDGDNMWDTTPNRDPGAYAASHSARANCYLGLLCNAYP